MRHETTRIRFEAGESPDLRSEGVPRLVRRDGRAWLVPRVADEPVDLGALPVGAELSMRTLDGCGSFEDRDVARLRVVGGGVEVEQAHGTARFAHDGPDAEVPAFLPHAVDVAVDGEVVRTVPLGDLLRAASTFLQAVDEIGPLPGRVATYRERPCDRLPWRLEPRVAARRAAFARRVATTSRGHAGVTAWP